MKKENHNQNPIELTLNLLTQIPQILEEFQEIKKSQLEILARLEENAEGRLGEFITEEKAQKILGKKKSWFGNLRVSEKFPYAKFGGTVWYKLDDFHQKLLNAYNSSL